MKTTPVEYDELASRTFLVLEVDGPESTFRDFLAFVICKALKLSGQDVSQMPAPVRIQIRTS